MHVDCTLRQKIQMLYRQACEEYSKGLGHGPLPSAVDVTNQTQDTVMFHHIQQKKKMRRELHTI